jgi:hypothetical protein
MDLRKKEGRSGLPAPELPDRWPQTSRWTLQRKALPGLRQLLQMNRQPRVAARAAGAGWRGQRPPTGRLRRCRSAAASRRSVTATQHGSRGGALPGETIPPWRQQQQQQQHMQSQ